MTPDERQLLSGLFDRIRTSSGQPRDREAESFIGDAIRSQPYAPYLLAQTVIVQDQALRAANDRLQQLEAKVRQLESGQPGPEGSTSFLGGLGRSIFGGGNEQPARQSPPTQNPSQQDFGGNRQGGGFPPQGGGFPPQGGPWGQGQDAPGQGGGFLKGALGAAAGVAGGVLLANSISGLMRGNQFGIGSGVPGVGGQPGGETIVNNYYEGDGPGGDSSGGYGSSDRSGGFDQAADFGSGDGDFGSGGDDLGSNDDYNV